jgi:ATP-dependent RNA helicase RhlE
MSFEKLGLDQALLRTIREKQFSHPTPIQNLAIPPALAGKDVLGCAQTGTGKTAAFALPILQQLASMNAPRGWRPIRSLILAPTRELAAQIGEAFVEFGRGGPLRHAVIFGGVNQRPQCAALRRGVDVLVATPGRLLDLIGQGQLKLDQVEILVLDEADRMLDMGFMPDIKRVVAMIPAQRQTMLFSATMPAEITRLARTLQREPVRVSVAPETPAADTVDQAVHHVPKTDKVALLQSILAEGEIAKAIVFTRTKHGADKVARKLEQAAITAAAMHSGKSQNQRLRTLEQFRKGRLRVLVASDIAARGLDVTDISHVFNFDMPAEAETYVHRIGRTGRAGLSGQAISFCSAEERPLLNQIERLLSRRLPVVAGPAGEAVEMQPEPELVGVGAPARSSRPRGRGRAPGRGAAAAGQRHGGAGSGQGRPRRRRR